MVKIIQQYFLRKKFLYTTCFVMLGMIDFVRHTQQQNVWGPLVNCSGVLLLIITASAYKLKEFRCGFSYIWSGILLILLILSGLWKEEHIFSVYKWSVFVALINVWLIGILAYQVVIRVFVEKTIHIKWNVVSVLGIIMTFFMMLSPIRELWPIWFLAVFGLFYATRFERTDFADLKEAMIDGIIIVFVILQVYACGYRPFDALRYVGAFSNCNMTALHYLITYTAILLKIHFMVMKGSAKKWRICLFIGAAVLLDFQILTMTRTAWGISVVITVLFGILIVKRVWGKGWNAVLKRAIMLGLSAMVLFPVVFATVRWLPPLRHHPIWYAGEWNEGKVHSFDPADSEKYTDFDEFMEEILGRLKIVGIIINPLVLKAQAAESVEYPSITLTGPEKLDLSLRIRLTIYRAYIRDFNWVGHKAEEGHYIISGLNSFVWHPQNVWIQIAYYYGIPAGILFLILTVLILWKEIRIIMKHREYAYPIIPFFISIVFLLYGLTEVVWIVGQMILCLFLFVQHPQFSEE